MSRYFNFGCLVAALLLAGCMTYATVDSRRQARAGVYQAMSPEFRAAVDAGQLKAGMDTNAVFIAWGQPEQTLHGGNSTEETITWVYRGSYVQEVEFVGTYREHQSYAVVPYTRAQVVFVNGVVRRWQTFASPQY